MNNLKVQLFVNVVRYLMRVLRFPLKTQTLHSFTGLVYRWVEGGSPRSGDLDLVVPLKVTNTHWSIFPPLLFITSNSYISKGWGVERGVHHMPTVASVISG